MNRTMNMKHFFAPSAWRLEGAANPLPCRGGAGVESVTLLRRAATALLLCVMTMTVQTAWAQSGNWSDYKAAAFSTINESTKTISITSEAELALLAYNTCNGTDYSGYTITLTKDLNMRAHYWDKSIGTELSYYSGNNSFRGTFNGANKTISGIYISSGSYKGLFGFVGMNEKPGTIQNVTLASSTITGDDNVGGIVGCLLYGTVSNCHVLSSVSILASGDGSNNHGGIVGQTYPNKKVSSATIENCTSAASVTDNGKSGCSDFGGIVGYNYYYSDTNFSKVTGCFYYGTAVSASSDAGAIVGLNYKADGTGISNCYYNYPSTISGIGFDNSDNGTTRVYTVTCTTSGLSTTGTATYTHNGTHYFAAGATATVSAPSQKIYALEATTGSISDVSIADDRHSATFTIGSGDVTLALSYSGTTSDGLTWSLGGTGFTELTIGGTGPMQAYGYTTGNIWKTKAPWGTDITSVTIGDGVTSIGNYAFIGCENVASITIGSGVTSIGIGAINHCDQMTSVTLPASVTTIAYAAFENCQKLETIYINHDGEVSLTGNHDNAFNAPLLQYIVFPSPVAALANTKETGNWARYKDNIRAQFGNQLFLATNEGGTAAYKIANEQDLRNLATAVNAGNNGSGKTFRQTLDITMSSTNFTPIGKNDNNYFSGTYDGGEKAIIGLTVNVTDNCFAGLFGCVSYGGKVKKLYLISPNANCSYSAGDSRVVGAVVGSLERNSTIEDCYVVNPKVTTPSGSGYLGVICGVSKSGENTITNCYFYDNNTSHKYKALVLSYGTITNVGRAYTIAATSPVTASATKAFTYDGTDYYVEGSTVTLSGGTPHTNGGWVDTYTVNSTAIEGNTFSLTADATVAYSSTPDATHFAETGTNEYTIYDATGWNVFCDLLESNDQGFFTGKTVVLDNDIAVTRMAGSTNHEFSGTFDGQTHTLTVAITGTVQGTAPFCEIKGATIRNLAVTGSVAGKRHSAGLVGFARGDNSVTNIIENCLVNTSVSITGDTNGYLGGIVGHGFTSALTIRGCAFTGSLTSTSNYTGGLQGWSDGNILTLQNDLFAPTSVSAANAGFHPVAFHNNNSTTTATVSNVYYTVAPTCTQATRIATANAAEQPKQARTIEAGENVTVEAISPVGSSTATYATSGITAYAKGITCGGTFYYGSGDEVSLTLGNSTPEGYTFDSYTASPDGTTLTEDGDNYTLTMPDADVTIGATFVEPVSYVDANGQTAQCNDYTVLTGGGATTLAPGWYVVNSDITYTGTVTLGGDVNIILCDGCTLNIGTKDARISSGPCIDGKSFFSGSYHYYSLTIYGQANQSGALNAYSNTSYINAVRMKNYTQHGGNVTIDHNNDGIALNVDDDLILTRGTLTATVEGSYYPAIHSDNLTFSGGNLTANGEIYSNATLGWTSATDFIKANRYAGTVTIAQGQTLYDEDGTPYSGTIEKVNGAYPIDGKTLLPFPDCISPMQLTATNITATKATLNWDGEQDSYNVRYRPAGGEGFNFIEGFEGIDNYTLPDDWTTADEAWFACNNYYDIEAYNGNNYAIDYDDHAWLITPMMDLSGQNNATLNFCYINSGQLEVYYRINGGAWTLLWSSEGSHTEWTEATINLTEDLSANYQIGFYYYLNQGGPVLLDDISITSTGTGANQWQTINNIAGTTTLLTGLSGETTYQWQVQGLNCDGNGSTTDWSEMGTFTTPDPSEAPSGLTATNITATTATLSWSGVQDSYVVQYCTADVVANTLLTEGFEGSDYYLPDGWTSEDRSWFIDNSHVNPHSGTRHIINYQPNKYLILPAMDLSGGGSATLNFWYINDERWNPTPAQLDVYYSINGGDWTLLWSSEGEHLTWTEATISLPNPSANYQIGFRMVGEGEPGLALDDIVVTGMGGGFGEWQNIVDIEATTTTLTGLTPDMPYQWQVKGMNCDGNNGSTKWSEMGTFTTNSVLELADNDSGKPDGEKNADLISGDNGTAKDVTLSGRKLYKDGYWNTLVLPFSMNAGQVKAQLAPTELKELDTEHKWANVDGQWTISDDGQMTGLDNGTLYLNFKDADAISAGVPYIIKWDSGDNIVNPVFSDVTIDSDAPTEVTFTGGKFVGTYNYTQYTNENKSILLLGEDNTLYYPQPAHEDPEDETSAMVYPSIGAFRAYFQLDDPASVRAFKLNFGDGSESTGIVEITDPTPGPSPAWEGSAAWYTLDGRRLDGQPTAKGLYIHGGRKVAIK